jgi:hypothetical protein
VGLKVDAQISDKIITGSLGKNTLHGLEIGERNAVLG